MQSSRVRLLRLDFLRPFSSQSNCEIYARSGFRSENLRGQSPHIPVRRSNNTSRNEAGMPRGIFGGEARSKGSNRSRRSKRSIAPACLAVGRSLRSSRSNNAEARSKGSRRLTALLRSSRGTSGGVSLTAGFTASSSRRENRKPSEPGGTIDLKIPAIESEDSP
mgnify:CR=1 FL=1